MVYYKTSEQTFPAIINSARYVILNLALHYGHYGVPELSQIIVLISRNLLNCFCDKARTSPNFLHPTKRTWSKKSQKTLEASYEVRFDIDTNLNN